MKKIILTYGVISGVVIILSIIASLSVSNSSNHIAGLEWLGYLVMIVALSMIFVGIKQYRDKHLGGVINFGTAVQLGLGISVVAGLIYVAIWEVNLAVTDHAFIGNYTDSVIEAKKAEGIQGSELATLIEKMENMKIQYAKPLYRLPMTFMEIFPVGLIITLLSSAILRHRKTDPK